MTGAIGVVALGRLPYREALQLQRELCRRRVAGDLSDDLLLLLEHDPVITLGRGTRDSSLPIPPEILRQRGVEVVEVERGGDVTVHVPGQLVGYPIFDLGGFRRDLHWYLRSLEETIIRALAQLDVVSGRRVGLTGVWVEDRKIASIGVHVKQWVTLHGFALNVVNALDLFDLVVPCGIPDVRMTTVAAEHGGGEPEKLFARAQTVIANAVGEVFERSLTHVSPNSVQARNSAVG